MKETLHVVPKADVDKMFKELYPLVTPNSPIARKLRGIVYANTFLAERETVEGEKE
jgi:hypothetical protein